MGNFKHFGDYMTSLLSAPLMGGRRTINQFAIFFAVVGSLFDDCKRDVFRVRTESMVMTASEAMLAEHGRDRRMPRLKGETTEAYRVRLAMKALVAEKAGTRQGVLLALAALGYEKSGVEPFYLHDPGRWAEFMVCLRSGRASGVNDLRVIDAEVCKVKEASAVPVYSTEALGAVTIRSGEHSAHVPLPLCGVTLCGVWPWPLNTGAALTGGISVVAGLHAAEPRYPLCGDTLSSGVFYQSTGGVTS